MDNTKTVVLSRERDRGYEYIFRNDGCWRAEDSCDDGCDLLDDSDSWYLADSLESQPGISEATTVAVMYPYKYQFNAFLKHSHVAELHYLPVWSLEELKKAAPLHRRSLKEVEERHGLIGGIPFYVLASNYSIDSLINEAVSDLTIGKFNRLARFLLPKEGIDKICPLVQFDVHPSYLDFSLKLASQYASDKVLKKFIVRENRELKELLMKQPFCDYELPLRANLFEAYAHRLLSGGGEFPMYPLDEDIKRKLHVLPGEIERFHNISQCTDQNQYYIPWDSNHVCIDSVSLNTGYFRITMTMKFDIPEGNLMETVDALEMDRLYFVVPDVASRNSVLDEVFDSKKATGHDKVKGRRIGRARKTSPRRLDHLRRYVIYISAK